MGQAVENGSDQTLDLAIHVVVTIESNETVEEQGGESVHGRPNHEVGSGARRFGQEAGIDQPIQLRHEHVMGVGRNRGSGFSPAGSEHEACDGRVIERPPNVAATELDKTLLRPPGCASDRASQALSDPRDDAIRQRTDQSVARLEVMIRGAGTNADLRGHFAHGPAVERAFPDESFGGVEQGAWEIAMVIGPRCHP